MIKYGRYAYVIKHMSRTVRVCPITHVSYIESYAFVFTATPFDVVKVRLQAQLKPNSMYINIIHSFFCLPWSTVMKRQQ